MPTHLEHARNSCDLVARAKLERLLLLLHPVHELLDLGELACRFGRQEPVRHWTRGTWTYLGRGRCPRCRARSTRCWRRCRLRRPSVRRLVFGEEREEDAPALDDERNEQVWVLGVIVLEPDAEEQRLALADERVDVCAGTSSTSATATGRVEGEEEGRTVDGRVGRALVLNRDEVGARVLLGVDLVDLGLDVLGDLQEGVPASAPRGRGGESEEERARTHSTLHVTQNHLLVDPSRVRRLEVRGEVEDELAQALARRGLHAHLLQPQRLELEDARAVVAICRRFGRQLRASRAGGATTRTGTHLRVRPRA